MNIKIVILGAGPGGYVAAIRAAQLGANVTIIEKSKVGGTCLNHGCIPSKIFKQSADTLNTIKQCENFAIKNSADPTLDLESLKSRTKNIIASQSKGIEGLLKKHTINIVEGEGRFISKNSIVVEKDGKQQELTFDKAIIATGSIPTQLPFLPFDGEQVLSSDHIFSLKSIPQSMVIIGGGVIGCEFACIMNSFGCEVTVIEGLDRLLPIPSIDEECSKLLLREMKKKKIKAMVNSKVMSAEVTAEGIDISIITTSKNGKEKTQNIKSDKVLVCIGRKSISDKLDLSLAKVDTDKRGWITTDNNLLTSNQNIFAIGDILGPNKIMLAHTASSEGEIAAENCIGKPATMDWQAMPSGIFTMPEIGCVGLSEQEATELYGQENILAESSLFRTIGKAQVLGEIAGMAKIVCKKENGEILGIHIVGPHATDLLGEASIIVKNSINVQQLSTTIHAHPTLCEVLLETAFKLVNMPLHS
ncbi:MAG: dihydrolipoyl dehydrogenase [Desulfotalea sp.]